MAWAKSQEWYSSRQGLKAEAGAVSQSGVLGGRWVEKHDALERNGGDKTFGGIGAFAYQIS